MPKQIIVYIRRHAEWCQLSRIEQQIFFDWCFQPSTSRNISHTWFVNDTIRAKIGKHDRKTSTAIYYTIALAVAILFHGVNKNHNHNRKNRCTTHSWQCRSRISPRWARQRSGGGGGRQHTILPNFPKRCMKLKECGPNGGVKNFTMWIRHCLNLMVAAMAIAQLILTMNGP